MNLTYKRKIHYQIKKPLQVKERKEKRKETNTLFNIKKKRITKYKNIILCKNKNTYL